MGNIEPESFYQYSDHNISLSGIYMNFKLNISDTNLRIQKLANHTLHQRSNVTHLSPSCFDVDLRQVPLTSFTRQLN